MGTWQPGEDEQNTPAAQQGRGAPRRALCAALVALAAFVATLLFGSGLSLLPPAGAAPRTMPLSRAHLQDAALLPEGIWVPGTGGSTATFYLAGTESRTLQVQLYAEDTADFPVTVSLYLLADDASADARILADRAVLNPAGRHNSAVLMLHSYGKLYGFELEFSTASGAFLLTDVTLNQSGFAFNFPLFLLLLALGLGGWAVWAFGLWRVVWQPQKRSHRRAMRAVVALCVLLVFGIMLAVSPPPAPGDSLLLQPYTPENLPANAHYVHLFDALYNGQLALRTAPDAALATLQNPYDASQRGSIPFFWDMAYYNGQYYCYFGLAPMPLYFLVHALTGRLPSPALAAGVPAMLAVLLLWAALKELLLRWEVKANLLLLALGFPALCLGGGLGLLAASADTYVQPYLWATAGLAGCVWLFYRALRCQSGAARVAAFAGAGVCLALVATARPLVVLLCLAFIVPAGVGFLRGGAVPPRGRAAALLAFLLPVALAAAGLGAYNAARFSAPWDFGTPWQLTVGDMRHQTLRFAPAWFAETLRQFLFMPLGVQSRFPYLFMRGSDVLYGNRFFNYYALGLGNFPLYWALAFAPGTLRRASAEKKATAIALAAASAFVLWCSFCLSNILYRYICDVSFALGLLALAVLLQRLARRPVGAKPGALYAAAALALFATCAVGLLLVFSNERNWVLYNRTDIYLAVAKLLQFR